MYLFEKPPQEGGTESDIAYWASGKPQELQRFRDAVRVAALSAIAANEVSIEDSIQLIDEKQSQTTIYIGNTAHVLKKVIGGAQVADDGESNLTLLRHRYIERASEGSLTLGGLAEALRMVHATQDYLSNESIRVRYVSVDGYDCNMTTHGMYPRTYDIELLGDARVNLFRNSESTTTSSDTLC